MNRSIFVLGALMATSLMAHDPNVSQCLANPLATLNGKWVFQLNGAFPNIYGITGVFTATQGLDRGGNPIGNLSITASSITGGSDADIRDFASQTGPANFVRLETDAGRYQINSTCSGGTLTFNMSSRPMQFDFWILDGGRSLYIISTTPGRTAHGRATLAPTGCPAGVNPLSLLVGNSTFLAASFDFSRLNPYAISGVWNGATALDRGGNTIGTLGITATSILGNGGSVARYEWDAGRYQANADCSGGTLTFNLSSRPIQFDFWYADGFAKLYFISTNTQPVIGEAAR